MQPNTIWAQRKDGFVLVTVNVIDAADPKIELTPNSFHFTGNSDNGQNKYDVTLELFEEIVVEESKYLARPRGFEMKLMKKDKNIWWPRLAKTTRKLHYVSVDWAKWVDEDDEDEDKDFGWNGEGAGFNGDFDEAGDNDGDIEAQDEQQPEEQKEGEKQEEEPKQEEPKVEEPKE